MNLRRFIRVSPVMAAQWFISAGMIRRLARCAAYRLMGVAAEDVTEKNRIRYELTAKEGVVITKLRNRSHLAKIGAQPGDVIRKMDEMPIQGKTDFQ